MCITMYLSVNLILCYVDTKNHMKKSMLTSKHVHISGVIVVVVHRQSSAPGTGGANQNVWFANVVKVREVKWKVVWGFIWTVTKGQTSAERLCLYQLHRLNNSISRLMCSLYVLKTVTVSAVVEWLSHQLSVLNIATHSDSPKMTKLNIR